MMRYSSPAFSYQMINIFAGIIIIGVIAWTALFDSYSENMVECVYLVNLGEECSTCGITRSFSEMIKGDFYTASLYNRSGPLVFIFFVSQFVLRIVVTLILINIRQGKKRFSALAYSDSTISLLLFLLCFRHLLIFW